MGNVHIDRAEMDSVVSGFASKTFEKGIDQRVGVSPGMSTPMEHDHVHSAPPTFADTSCPGGVSATSQEVRIIDHQTPLQERALYCCSAPALSDRH